MARIRAEAAANNEAEKQALTTEALAERLKAVGVELFRERTGLPLNQAQRNLEEKTTYVDDKTMKKSSGQVHTVQVLEDGLVLGIVESVQKTSNPDDGRVFRPVFFDVFGNTIYKPEIADSFATSKQANSAFWRQADEIDAIKATMEGIKTKQDQLEADLDKYEALSKELGNEA
jgi:hypothetical protein